jgi:predicted transcriptional regulator
MDEETASLIDALRHPGAALLLGLLDAELTEDQLLDCAPYHSQSAVNRKLQGLAERNLIRRETGSKQQKGLRWGLLFRNETEDLLEAANKLARRSVEHREEQVGDTARQLRRIRARSRLRDVSEDAGA